jgi:hypothetical protein
MHWHAYHLPPIDYAWEYLATVEETRERIRVDYERAEAETFGSGYLSPQTFMNDWEAAKLAARQQGWEGDFRVSPKVLWFPSELQFSYGFAFKQDNNGSTFVVSPVALAWLDELDLWR